MKNKPEVIKSGNVQIKIYTYQNKGYPEFKAVIAMRGKRTLETFEDHAEADARAWLIASKLSRGGRTYLPFAIKI